MSQAVPDGRRKEVNRDHPVWVGTPSSALNPSVASLQWPPLDWKGSTQAAFVWKPSQGEELKFHGLATLFIFFCFFFGSPPPFWSPSAGSAKVTLSTISTGRGTSHNCFFLWWTWELSAVVWRATTEHKTRTGSLAAIRCTSSFQSHFQCYWTSLCECSLLHFTVVTEGLQPELALILH